MAELQPAGAAAAGSVPVPATLPEQSATQNNAQAEQPGRFSNIPLVANFQRLAPQQRLMLLIGLPLLLGLIIAALMWSTKATYKPLFTNVTETDGGAIIEALAQMNVPYEYSENGGSILVPEEMVYDTRLQLASQGLPKGSVVGFEVFENQKMGVTQFQEQVNFQRGLEGELIRSIQSLDAVKTARVHLALPKNSVFLREQQKPTASVVVALYRGMYLSKAQLDGVVHLVSSSVPQLSPRDVSVVDQTGELLTGSGNPNDPASLSADQMAKVEHIEATYTRRVMDLLTPIVGEQNVRATVTAKVDFKEVESSAETYKPNAANGASIRSQQSMESTESAGKNPGGVPGMISNEPGGVEARIGGQAGDGNNGNGGEASAMQSRENLTNYEVDREIVRTKSNQVDVAMLNAAVLLNYKTITNNRGETRQVPFTEEEVTDIRNMVSDALGINTMRGDTLSVLNQNFVDAPSVDPYAPPAPHWSDYLKSTALPLTIAAIALGLIFGVFRPMLRPQNDDGDVLDADSQADLHARLLAQEEERSQMLTREKADPLLLEARDGRQVEEVQRVVKENPELAANIVKGWIGD